MVSILSAIFFVSGAAALVFETLWFRQAGLAFGNGVWASSLVLASFMAGLALGNALMVRYGPRIRRPLQLYAGLEVAIALGGVALVWALPSLGRVLAPWVGALQDDPLALGALRLAISFVLMLMPATAMGATLPVLVHALRERVPNFGELLGRLYGWNTAGAVLGALAGEMALVGWLGVRGAALVAAGADLLAGAVALALSRGIAREGAKRGDERAPVAALPLSRRSVRLAAAAFLSGGLLLALEVVWFRFLQLFVFPGALTFAVMLAVVLAGIALGGHAAGQWMRIAPAAHRHASALAMAAGTASIAIYAGFARFLDPYGSRFILETREILWLSAVLMAPVSLLSGVLFTLTGAALQREVGPEARAAGLVTLANTVGAFLGSLLAGFAMLPLLGMETSLFVLSALYGLVGLLLLPPRGPGVAPRWAAAAALVLAVALFPTGRMEDRYLGAAVMRFGYPEQAEIAEVREGRTETLVLLRSDLMGETISYALVTNGFSMADTTTATRRYMKLFVYWPIALHPDARTALLISYGVGSTARALTATRNLERITVVDISREILALSDVVYPEPGDNPLRDPRVETIVEDGRYFLQTTSQQFDLITAEPPPPKHAGVVNLYSREYFQLVYERLAPGGLNTHWLPMHTLTPRDAKAIIRAYCDVFADCTLWSGAGLSWMLAGSRDGKGVTLEAAFVRQWSDPQVAPELRALGLEVPEQLGALFLADARSLEEQTRGVEPLVDDWPKRLSHGHLDRNAQMQAYLPWLDTKRARRRFEASEFVRRSWPEGLRRRTLGYFDYQHLFNQVAGLPPTRPDVGRRFRELDAVLNETTLETLPLWQLGGDPDRLRALDRRLARGESGAWDLRARAVWALSARDFDGAARLFARAHAQNPHDESVLRLRLYSLCMAGRVEDADEVVRQARARLPVDAKERGYWAWMSRRFGLYPPEA